MTNERHPWELIQDKTIQQLVFSYEMVLTEMRTHSGADPKGSILKEWVSKLDFARDEFVRSMLVVPDKAAHETHGPGCWRDHHACAVRQVELLSAELGNRLRAAESPVEPEKQA